MKAQTTNINEELGQIEYIFSDKTGTLTCNIMEFKKFSAEAGSFNFTSDAKAGKPQDGLRFYEKADLDEASSQTSHEANSCVEEVLLHLALCHSVIIDKRTNKMNSESPDELALVEGAASQGFSFEGKDGEGLITIKRKRDGETLRF